MSANTTIETLDIHFNKLLSDSQNLERCITEIEKMYDDENISREALQKFNRKLFFKLNIVNSSILTICTILDTLKLDPNSSYYLDIKDYLDDVYDDKLYIIDNYFDYLSIYTYKNNFNSVFQNFASMYCDILSEFFDDEAEYDEYELDFENEDDDFDVIDNS